MGTGGEGEGEGAGAKSQEWQENDIVVEGVVVDIDEEVDEGGEVLPSSSDARWVYTFRSLILLWASVLMRMYRCMDAMGKGGGSSPSQLFWATAVQFNPPISRLPMAPLAFFQKRRDCRH